MGELMQWKKKVLENQPHIAIVSDSIAHFNTDMPTQLKQTRINFLPIQNDNNDISPTNIQPITGRTGINIYKDPNINWNQLIIDGTFTNSNNWSAGNSTYGSISLNNNIATWTCSTVPTQYYQTGIAEKANHVEIPENHIVLLTAQVKSSVADRIALYALVGLNEHTSPCYANVNANEWTSIWGCAPARSSGKIVGKGKVCYGSTSSSISNIVVGTTLEVKNFMMFDLTQMFGEGNEPTVEQFKTLFNASYYTYNLGTPTTIGTTINNITAISIDWTSIAGTLYGGYIDLVNGKLVKEWNKIKIKDCSVGLTSNTTTAWHNWFVNLPYEYKMTKNFSETELPIRCDTFLATPQTGGYLTQSQTKPIVWASLVDGNLRFKYIDDCALTAAEFKTKYGEVEIAYKLETPIEYSLTPQQIIAFKGTNNIWSSANGTVDIKYWTH